MRSVTCPQRNFAYGAGDSRTAFGAAEDAVSLHLFDNRGTSGTPLLVRIATRRREAPHGGARWREVILAERQGSGEVAGAHRGAQYIGRQRHP